MMIRSADLLLREDCSGCSFTNSRRAFSLDSSINVVCHERLVKVLLTSKLLFLLSGDVLLCYWFHVHDDPTVQRLWRPDCCLPADGAV